MCAVLAVGERVLVWRPLRFAQGETQTSSWLGNLNPVRPPVSLAVYAGGALWAAVCTGCKCLSFGSRVEAMMFRINDKHLCL